MRSTESHQATSPGRQCTVRQRTESRRIRQPTAASKLSATLGARHIVYEPSNPAVVADSSRQATDLIVTPATAAVCPGIVTRQSQSLFKDSTDQNAVPVRMKKTSLHYTMCVTTHLMIYRLAFAR